MGSNANEDPPYMLVILRKEIIKHCHLIKAMLTFLNGGWGRKMPVSQHSAEKFKELFSRTHPSVDIS